MRPTGGGALSNAHAHRGGGNSMHTNGIAACIARDTERQIQSTGWSALEQETYALSSPETHTHPSHQSSSTAPSQPAVWPCQMTYDTQHLRPIGGGALSNAHSHTQRGRGSSKHTNGIAACIARDRERQIQSNGCQHSRARDSRPVLTRRTHTPIPPVQQQIETAAQPAVWYP